MLWVVAGMLFLAWIVGLVKEPMGGFIHVLLALALLAAGTELALAWRRKRLERTLIQEEEYPAEYDEPTDLPHSA